MWLGNVKALLKETLVRHYSRKAAVNVRKINPKVPTQEAYSIAQSLYDIIKHHGPLTVSNTWIHAKVEAAEISIVIENDLGLGSGNLLSKTNDGDAGISGLNSKTHMKIMLKWMRGRKMLKLFCNGVGSSKKFLHSTLPEEPQSDRSESPLQAELQDEKPSRKKGKMLRQ